MTAPKEILQLVGRFREQREAYLNPHYNEAQLRQEFLNPFFEALGWDVDNKQSWAEAYKEVIHEASVKVGIETKAPDYSFRIGGTRKFFLEAKKPSVNINEDPSPAFQLRRYAWSAKLPLSILSNFAEFAVYDCRIRPVQNDKPSKSRMLYFTVDQYADHWDEIASIFSKDAVLKGSFDKYATAKGKKGTAEVDDAFLEEIESWREALAKNIALRNADLTPRELNFAVQQTIDRIIFLRIGEDRSIEPYGKLRGLLNGHNVYARLRQLFHDADDRYNSGLFHFRREAGRGEPDSLTLGLEIDDKVLKEILENLYYPESPYEFSVLPADILGQVYEQFLGKVIRLTAGGHAKVEDKPEVKKAGGVYYTPTYIVDYIVKNTVGKLVEGKKPEKVAELKILDPACGSGSFLIGAYQYLLDWYLHWYSENEPEKHAKSRSPKIFKAQGNMWRLTTAERKRILLNNIYGVDIDPQAVEVTKLSLLLKVLEEESAETLGRNWEMFHERALPDLDNNIKCGNSLIGPEFYEGKLDLDPEERRRINAFDWHAEFPVIFKAGGFDAVIGNPPYGAQLTESEKAYLSNVYAVVSDYESAQFFILRSSELTKLEGAVCFIVPNTIFLNLYARKFRQFLAENFEIKEIANLSKVDVFKNASVRTAIPLIRKKALIKSNLTTFLVFDGSFQNSESGATSQKELLENDSTWITCFSSPAGAILLKKAMNSAIPLGSILDISQGLIPYDKYRGHDEHTIKNRIWHAENKKDKTYKRELRGGDVTRYNVCWNGKQWISYGPWLAAPRKPEYFNRPRLLFREITDSKTGLLNVAYTEEEFYNNPGLINCISCDANYSLLYLLGIANSRLIAYLHFTFSPKARKGIFPKILVDDVRRLPVRAINFSDRGDRALHDKMVKLVEEMFSLHRRLAAAKTPHEKTALQRQIDATDKQIDQLVYELYGLTEEEIRIVEGDV